MKMSILALIICLLNPRVLVASDHTDEAQHLKTAYLKNNHFVAQLPDPNSGKASGIGKQLSSHFSSHSEPAVTGRVVLAEFQGLFRLKVASTDNLLYQQQPFRVNIDASVSDGVFHIYSPVEMDFWQMAKLFVDRPDTQRPTDDQWLLRGYVVTTVDAGQTVTTSATLSPMANEYQLLIYTNQTASDVQLIFR
ncbi:hypothetical protein ACFODZ_07150 [Marinicella sediminis]|uniref:DUF3261 domain-containing protein n=1 Tax=Marinicella sediminis TaxID=1792834 RepID=A0ABV7J7A2_9GAMM|nr:hypothetical protein [Marinicella sediminis]